MRLTIIPIGWRVAGIAIFLLALSLWGNVYQYGTKRAEVEKARADVLADTLKVTAGLARDYQHDTAQLYIDLSGIVSREKQWRNKYASAAKANPLPANCAPGQARMDAVNAGIPNRESP